MVISNERYEMYREAANSGAVFDKERMILAQLATAEATMEVARQLARQTEMLEKAAQPHVPQGGSNGQ